MQDMDYSELICVALRSNLMHCSSDDFAEIRYGGVAFLLGGGGYGTVLSRMIQLGTLANVYITRASALVHCMYNAGNITLPHHDCKAIEHFIAGILFLKEVTYSSQLNMQLGRAVLVLSFDKLHGMDCCPNRKGFASEEVS
mmetsp:Transcript_4096/g.11264  ORF Transcript_4096/g.11264 Transcript_4096/m.11264 type:complete len:141 (-) Transcript_4096:165-587(-)